MVSGYEREQTELKQELESIKVRIREMDMRELCIREFIIHRVAKANARTAVCIYTQN